MTPTLPLTDAAAAANGLHNPPAPEPPAEAEEEFDPDLLARLRELDWLDGELNAGRLDQYYGEYVYAAEHTILGHDVFMDRALAKAEAKAAELGIRLELLTNYCIPSLDYPMKVS